MSAKKSKKSPSRNGVKTARPRAVHRINGAPGRGAAEASLTQESKAIGALELASRVLEAAAPVDLDRMLRELVKLAREQGILS